jgi:membrane-bound lytic murein transglycosylase MltF
MAAILVLSACLGCAEPEPSPPPQAAVAVEAGDLAQIVESGQLRVLLPLRVGTDRLPRKGRPLFDYDRELAAAYAEQLGVDPVLIYVESREELIPSLLEGRGDLVGRCHLHRRVGSDRPAHRRAPLVVVLGYRQRAA